MSIFLRQATASQTVIIGPFLDDTDGKTPETGLTIANTDIQLMANGAAAAAKNSGGATHRTNGEYSITLDATDTATVGELAVSVLMAGALVVRAKFFVLEEAVFDALFGAGAVGYSTYGGGDTAGVTTLLSRLSSARAGYLDKLNVSGVLAHTDNAATFKADVSGLSTFNPASDELENGVTYQKAWQGQAAVLLGTIATAGEAAEVYQAVGNPGTTRVTVGGNADGDRTTVVIA